MIVCGEEDHDHITCLKVFPDLLNFTGGLLPGESQTEDCCLVSGSYWYRKVSLPVTMSQTHSDLPPSNFRTVPLSLGQLVGYPTGAALP